MPPPGLAGAAPSSSSSAAGADGTTSAGATNEGETNLHSAMQEPDPADGQLMLEPAVKDLEEAVTAYLRRATETFDLSKNVEVCSY